MRQLIKQTYDWRHWTWGRACLLTTDGRTVRVCYLSVYIGVM